MMRDPVALAQPQVKGEKDSHRVHTLNKVFMEKICDLLSTGQNSSLFTGHGLEISKVKVSSGMTAVNVHWYCAGSDKDKKLEELLEESSHMLRHELTQQRVIGRVPPIIFVKDRRFYKLMEVERRLAVADYGEDFDPSDPSHGVKSSLIMKAEFDSEIKSRLDKKAEEDNSDYFAQAMMLASSQFTDAQESLDDLPPDLPIMRHDVLGVDTSKLFNVVRHSMIRARAEHRKNTDNFSEYKHAEKDVGHRGSRTEEIRQWATRYEELRRKEKRAKKRDKDWVTVSHIADDDIDEIVYEEEEDYFDDMFELPKEKSGEDLF